MNSSGFLHHSIPISFSWNHTMATSSLIQEIVPIYVQRERVILSSYLLEENR
jgi:hypothetical protein